MRSHPELIVPYFKPLLDNLVRTDIPKAFSLTVLQHLAALYPDIKPELRLVIEEQWEQAAPAFRSRAKKILKEL